MTDRSFDLDIEDDNEHHTNAPQPDAVGQSDSGRAANLVLLGCSILQLPIWGKPQFCCNSKD